MRNTILILLFFSSFSVSAQSVFSTEISGHYKDATLIEVFLDIEKRYNIPFYYDPGVLPYYKVNYKFSSENLFAVLQKMLPQNNLSCTAAGDKGVVVCRKTDISREYIAGLIKSWEEGKIELPSYLTPLKLNLQTGEPPASKAKTVDVEGFVQDEQTQEGVPGVTVKIEPGAKGAVTDRNGRFSLRIAPGEYTVTVNFVGYRETIVQLAVYQGGEFTAPLQVRALELAGVEIQGEKAADKQRTASTGVELLSSRTIKELPAFLGESDVVKSLTVLPGVTTVGEGATGFNVRGGNIDQNLIVQDELTYFNTGHVLGFFSIFNPDMVRTATLYKGHMPARFGGRVSSALEIKQRDGNFQEWHGSAGAGLSTAKLTLEGPVVKNRWAMIGGIRASYSDWMLRKANLPEVKSSSAWYNDVNLRSTLRNGNNGSVSLSLHRSRDYFRYAREFGYAWSTSGVGASWKRAWTPDFLMQASGSYSALNNRYFDPEGTDAFDLDNGLRAVNLSLGTTILRFPKHDLGAGLQWNFTQVFDQQLSPADGSGLRARSVPGNQGAEWALYIDDEYKWRDRWIISAGFRYSFYQSLGPDNVFVYEPGVVPADDSVIDTLSYARGNTIKTYHGPEPRLSMKYQASEKLSFKLSYNRLRQYVHLMTNTTAATPADIWQTSDPFIKPQIGDGFSLGAFYTGNEGRWDNSLEGYFRNTRQVPAYRDFAILLMNDRMEGEVIGGRQRAWGMEYQIRKNTGKITGWASYTWSRAWQQAVSPWPALTVNRGEWFPANFDQPHQVSLFAKWAINPALFWNFNFTYRSGRPVTAPFDAYTVGNILVPNFSDRNNLRIPDYHRLDVSLTIDQTKSKLKGLKTSVNFSIYNVYGRKNPYSVFFKRDANGLPKAYQLAVIGSAIPAATLTIHW